MSRRAIGAVLVLLVVVGAIFLPAVFRRRPSDEERIRALFERAELAVQEKRISDAVVDVSERFSGQGVNKQEVKRLIAFHVYRGTWVALVLVGQKVAVQGDEARAVVDVLMSRSGKGKPLSELLPEEGSVHRFDCHLAREAEGWKVTAASWRPISLQEAMAGPELPPSQ